MSAVATTLPRFGALACAALLCGATVFVATAQADEPVPHEARAADEATIVSERLALPLDGRVVDLEHLLDEHRLVEVVGTVSRAGSTLDAFHRQASGTDFEADGPFVLFPEGAEIVADDLATHSYRVRLPEGDARVSFAIARIAAANLLTRSEAVASLRGRLELLVRTAPIAAPAPDPAPTFAAAMGSSRPGSSTLVPVVLGALVFGLILGGILWRRRDRWARWSRRARRAVGAVAREGRRLGPAYDPVVATAEELGELAAKVREHAREIAKSKERITGVGAEARALEDELDDQMRVAEARMEALVSKLEGVAARLAAEVADHARVDALDESVGTLGRELEIALVSDREARSS